MAKTVDQLLIEIKAETSQLQKDLKQVKSKLGESNKEAKKFKDFGKIIYQITLLTMRTEM